MNCVGGKYKFFIKKTKRCIKKPISGVVEGRG